VENQGGFTETATVFVFYDDTSAATDQTVTDLASGASTTLTFTWDTSGVAEGTYTIKAEVPPVQDEEDTEDNLYVDGEVTVTLAPQVVHDIAITSVTPSATSVVSGELVSITVVAKNEGTEAETFAVTVYYDANAIGVETVTDLAPGASQTLSFSWDTTDVIEGEYTMKAVADTVLGETDIEDNTYIDGVVKVSEAPPPVGIIATINIEPETLNLKSQGRWITCFIQLPEGYSVEDIDIATILLENNIPAEWTNIEDSVLIVKFDRAAVIQYIRDILDITSGEVALTIAATLVDGTSIEAADTIRVISKGKR